MDKSSYSFLTNLDLLNVELIKIQDFEKNDKALAKAKKNRSIVEYYFTCTPSIILYVLNNFENIDQITYLDADLFFYSDPNKVFLEIGDSSIAIIEHRYFKRYKKMIKYGIYNVGWMTFRNNKNAYQALSWWRNSCNEWCYKKLENGKYADQKYLDNWEKKFTDVKIIKNKGANLATWNIENYKIVKNYESIMIDDDSLVFFHFHGFKRLLFDFYTPGYSQTHATKIIRDQIYKPYLSSYLKNHSISKNKFKKTLNVNQSGSFFNFMRKFLSLSYRILFSGNYVKK